MTAVVLVGLAVIAVVAGVEYMGRALSRHAKRPLPYLAGFGVCFIVAVVLVIVPAGARRIPALAVVVGLLFVASFVCLRVLASVGPTTRPIDEWAVAHGVELTDRNTNFVAHYVVQGHRLGLVCGLGEFVAAGALSAGTGVDLRVTGWVWLLSGYLVGVVWSESWLTRLPAGAHRAASLTPRRLAAYLPRYLRAAPVAAVCATTALGALALAAGSDGALSRDAWSSFRGASAASLRHDVIGIGVGALVLAACVALLGRHVVRKPQPLDDQERLAADDAVRASAVHLMTATVVAIVLILAGTQLQMLAALDLVPDAVALFAWIVCLPAAFVIWRFSGHRAWVVRGRSARAERRTLESASP